MCYTDEQIENYLQIFQTLASSRGWGVPPPNRSIRCWNCHSDRFFVNLGYNICEECGVSLGHALGFYDQKEYDRFHFRTKSIYQRKYH